MPEGDLSPEVPPRDYVTIVSGLPRSGTSLLMQMLVAGGLPPYSDGERTPDDDNPRGYYEHAAVKRLGADNAWLPSAKGKVVKVIAQLLQHVPAELACRVVFVNRNLDEVLRSQTIMLERSGQKGAGVPAGQLSKIFAGQLAAVREMLAKRAEVQVLELEYAEVVENPSATATQLDEWLGGGLDTRAMAAAVDAKLYRNRSTDSAS